MSKDNFREAWRCYAETLKGTGKSDEDLRESIVFEVESAGAYLEPHEITWVIDMIREMEAEDEEKKRDLNLMYKVMMDDKEAIETLQLLTCAADKLATKCADVGLDIGSLCGLMATMIDKYQSITKVSNNEIYAAWDIVRNVRDKVNDICGDPLEMSGI